MKPSGEELSYYYHWIGLKKNTYMYKHFVLNFQNKSKTKETETITDNLQVQTCTETLYLKSAESFGQSSEIEAEVFLRFLGICLTFCLKINIRKY